ncbi:MAG: hypothetical protein ABJB12_03880 [Pseudomonadota bacterium]
MLRLPQQGFIQRNELPFLVFRLGAFKRQGNYHRAVVLHAAPGVAVPQFRAAPDDAKETKVLNELIVLAFLPRFLSVLAALELGHLRGLLVRLVVPPLFGTTNRCVTLLPRSRLSILVSGSLELCLSGVDALGVVVKAPAESTGVLSDTRLLLRVDLLEQSRTQFDCVATLLGRLRPAINFHPNNRQRVRLNIQPHGLFNRLWWGAACTKLGRQGDYDQSSKHRVLRHEPRRLAGVAQMINENTRLRVSRANTRLISLMSILPEWIHAFTRLTQISSCPRV